MSAMASQITSLTIVYSTVYSGADHRKHQSSMSLTFVRGIHRWPMNSTHKEPVTRKMFPFADAIMGVLYSRGIEVIHWAIYFRVILLVRRLRKSWRNKHGWIVNVNPIRAVNIWANHTQRNGNVVRMAALVVTGDNIPIEDQGNHPNDLSVLAPK